MNVAYLTNDSGMSRVLVKRIQPHGVWLLSHPELLPSSPERFQLTFTSEQGCEMTALCAISKYMDTVVFARIVGWEVA